MIPPAWSSYPNFEELEFDSPDVPGSGANMSYHTISKLQHARTIAQVKFTITSGYRTLQHNDEVGGVHGSAHTLGYACDISTHHGLFTFEILEGLIRADFKRIGLIMSEDLSTDKLLVVAIHVDDDPERGRELVWTSRV